MKPTDSLKQVVKVEVARAANSDFVETPQPHKPLPAATGWDPIEVWQRMIKEPRQRRAISAPEPVT